MDIITVISVTELLNKLQELGYFMMHRGHGNSSWPLLPSIANLSPSQKGYENWVVLQNDLLERFRTRVLPYINPKPENHLEWLIIAQHYGLPTCLLDWTTNPLKALFFAVENPSHDVDGAVWAFEPTGYYTELTQLFKSEGAYLDSLASYLPPHIDLRIVAQESCFTFFPLLESTEPIQPLDNVEHYKAEIQNIVKFVIPKGEKEFCRYDLQKLGISHMSLFPGLDGIAKGIRRELGLSW